MPFNETARIIIKNADLILNSMSATDRMNEKSPEIKVINS